MNMRDRTLDVNNRYTAETSKQSFIAKVFGYAAAALLVSTVVAVALGLVFSYLIGVLGDETASIIYLFSLIGSAVGIFIINFVIHFMNFSNRSILVPGILYSILIGIMLSSFVMFIDWYILSMAFGITTLLFALMYLIVRFTKKTFSKLGMFGAGMLLGIFLMSIIFGILALFMNFGLIVLSGFASSGLSQWAIYWIYFGIDSLLLVAMLSITMWDIGRINKISERGENSKNLALYCAYIIYTDYIYVLLRIIRILLVVFNNKK